MKPAAKPLPQSAGTFHELAWDHATRHEVASATVVLSLGVIGNAILPVPYAFSISGAVAGVIIFTVAALCNRYTCALLLRGAVASATCDYETLAEAIAGPAMRWSVEISNVLLLLGTTAGGLIQIGGAAASIVTSQDWTLTWWTDNNGFWPTIIFTLGGVFPLCMLPSMRQLELAGAAGSIIVFGLAIVILAKSASNGLPQLGNTFPVWGFNSLEGFATAFSLANFGMYLQAMLMPLLGEMSPGAKGAAAARKATSIALLGPALCTYLISGFFGAAMYGDQTAANALENEWLPGVGTVVLNILVSIYLIISMPPIVFACVYTVRNWVALATGGRTRNLPSFVSQLISTLLVIGICLAVALAVPGQSGVVLSFTSATFVLAVSYLFPVLFHAYAYLGRARYQQQKAAAEADLAAELAGRDDPELAAKEEGTDGSEPGGCGESAGVPLQTGGGGGGEAPEHLGDAQPPGPEGGETAEPRLSPFDMALQHPPSNRHEPAIGTIPESGPAEMPQPGSSLLHALPSELEPLATRRSSRSLFMGLLHASNSAAPQRSQELLLLQGGPDHSGALDRQALFRHNLLRTSILPQSTAASGLSRHLSHLVSAKMAQHHQLDPGEEEDLVLALLPPYRRRTQRHKAVEFVVEVALPAVVLALGFFFSVSTLVLLF